MDTQLIEPTRETWLANRVNTLGSSEWAIALGAHPKKSRFQLAGEKLGRFVPEDISENEDIEFGNALEPICIDFLAKRTGREVVRWNQNESVISATHSFLSSTPDALQIDSERGKGTVEAKNRAEYVGHEWKKGPPLIVHMQIQAQMFTLGLKWGTICVIIGGNKFRWYDVELNEQFIAAVLPKLQAFWDLIERDELPEIDASESCATAIAQMFPESIGTEILLPDSFRVAYDELTEIKRCQKLLDTRRNYIENEFKLSLGDNSTGIISADRVLSWKSQSRVVSCPHCKEVISESSFRVLRQHDRIPKQSKLLLPDRTCEQPLFADNRVKIVAKATAALLSRGAILRHESESGSRYFELAGGLQVRIADHEPNYATEKWIGRNEVASIRIVCDDWKEQLEAITGPLDIE